MAANRWGLREGDRHKAEGVFVAATQLHTVSSGMVTVGSDGRARVVSRVMEICGVSNKESVMRRLWNEWLDICQINYKVVLFPWLPLPYYITKCFQLTYGCLSFYRARRGETACPQIYIINILNFLLMFDVYCFSHFPSLQQLFEKVLDRDRSHLFPDFTRMASVVPQLIGCWLLVWDKNILSC